MQTLSDLDEKIFFNITNLSHLMNLNPTTQGTPTFDFLSSLKEILESLEFQYNKEGKLNGVIKKSVEEIENMNFIVRKLKSIEGLMKKDDKK